MPCFYSILYGEQPGGTFPHNKVGYLPQWHRLGTSVQRYHIPTTYQRYLKERSDTTKYQRYVAEKEREIRALSKKKNPPPHIENKTCDAVFEYTNRPVILLEGQEPQLWPRLQAIRHAASHSQLPPVVLKMHGFIPTPAST